MNSLLFTYQLMYHVLKSKSRKGHSVHSPYMYELCRNVLSSKDVPVGAERAMEIKNGLLKNTSLVKRLDLGAGHIKRKKAQDVASLARASSASAVQMLLLARMSAHLRPSVILELGTCLGLGAISMAGSAPESSLHTIEACPETACLAKENIKRANLSNIHLHMGSFDEILSETLKVTGQIDMAYIDGNHRGGATLRYFKQLLPYSAGTTVMVFDDIRWSRGMLRAWHEIRGHPKVRVSMDLFTMGVVFFRRGLSRQHYRFRPRF